MQGLPRQDLKAVVKEGLILASQYSFDRSVPSILVVTEQRMPRVLQMDTNLMRSSRFKLALDEGHWTQSL